LTKLTMQKALDRLKEEQQSIQKDIDEIKEKKQDLKEQFYKDLLYYELEQTKIRDIEWMHSIKNRAIEKEEQKKAADEERKRREEEWKAK